MKFRCTKLLLIVGTIACLGAVLYFATPLKKVFETEEYGEEEEEEGEELTSGAGRQLEMFWQAQTYPDPTNANEKWLAAWEHYKTMLAPPGNNGSSGAAREDYGAWTSIGPSSSANPGGRMLSLAVHPTNTQTVFAGSAGGGIWKTTNGATSWSFVPTGLPVLAVPSIIISTANPNVMYAATGEVYRVDTSNIGFNVWKARGTYGAGVIKSTDGGVTWTQSLAALPSNLFGVQKLKFHPGNDNIVYACTTNGLFRTTDAGATWSNISTGFRMVTDVVINTGNVNQMMIFVGNLNHSNKGIWRTTNGSNATPAWTKILPAAGVPANYIGMGKFAYTTGNTVYAGFANGANNELYRSTDFGVAWAALPGSSYCSFQFWFTNAMEINPANANQLYLGGVDLHRYTIGAGTPLDEMGGAMHSDFHDIAFDPTDNNTAYIACDGGVYKSTTMGNTTPTFNQRNNGLVASQFYASFGVSSVTANLFVGGLQDNGTMRYNAGTWTVSSGAGGDGGPAAFVPGSSTLCFGSRDARQVLRSTDGGASFTLVTASWQFTGDSRTGFMAPISVVNNNLIYVGTDNLHKSTTGGVAGSFSFNTIASANNYISAIHKTAIAMAASRTNVNKVYVSVSPFAQGDNDENSLFINLPAQFRRTTTGNPPFTDRMGAGATALPDRFVTDIAINPKNDDTVMVTLGGYGSSHIYFTGDGGATWQNRGSDAIFPDVPFNAIVFDTITPGTVYAASDFGCYVSNNWGLKWHNFNDGFPVPDPTMIFDLQVTADHRLVAATHGRGVWISNMADATTLSANIIEFTGTNKNTINELKWKTSEEKQVLHYEVERKVDNGTFSKIGTVPAKNISGIADYLFNDNIAAVPGINYYYRLKIVDQDGFTKYSNVILVKVSRPGSLTILGNPVTASSNFMVTLPNAAAVTFNVYDAKGSLVATRRVNALQGNNRYSFTLFGALASGHYVLEARTPTERFSKRIIIQR